MNVRKRHSDINIYYKQFLFRSLFKKVNIKDTSNDRCRIVAICYLRPEKCFCKQNGPFFILQGRRSFLFSSVITIEQKKFRNHSKV